MSIQDNVNKILTERREVMTPGSHLCMKGTPTSIYTRSTKAIKDIRAINPKSRNVVNSLAAIKMIRYKAALLIQKGDNTPKQICAKKELRLG